MDMILMIMDIVGIGIRHHVVMVGKERMKVYKQGGYILLVWIGMWTSGNCTRLFLAHWPS